MEIRPKLTKKYQSLLPLTLKDVIQMGEQSEIRRYKDRHLDTENRKKV